MRRRRKPRNSKSLQWPRQSMKCMQFSNTDNTVPTKSASCLQAPDFGLAVVWQAYFTDLLVLDRKIYCLGTTYFVSCNCFSKSATFPRRYPISFAASAQSRAIERSKNSKAAVPYITAVPRKRMNHVRSGCSSSCSGVGGLASRLVWSWFGRVWMLATEGFLRVNGMCWRGAEGACLRSWREALRMGRRMALKVEVRIVIGR